MSKGARRGSQPTAVRLSPPRRTGTRMEKKNFTQAASQAEDDLSQVMIERGERRVTPQSFRDIQAADGRLAMAEYRLREVQVREQMARLRVLRMANQKQTTKPKSGKRPAEKYQDGARKGGGSTSQRHAGPQRASKPRPSGTKGSQLQKSATA
jgi:hypothetical protein